MNPDVVKYLLDIKTSIDSIEDFIGEPEKKLLSKEIYEELTNGKVLHYSDSIFGRDRDGIYQHVYLVDKQP